MTTERDENGDAEVQPIHTRRGDVLRIITEARAVVLTIADHHDAASIALDPAEADRIGRLLIAEAYVAEHG